MWLRIPSWMLIKCAIKDTFMNTDKLCDYGYIYGNCLTMWSRIHLWTLIHLLLWIHLWTLPTCVIMDTYDIKQQPSYWNIHKTWNIYICQTLHELENIMNINNWTIHTWKYLSTVINMKNHDHVFIQFTCIIQTINMYNYTNFSIYKSCKGVNKY